MLMKLFFVHKCILDNFKLLRVVEKKIVIKIVCWGSFWFYLIRNLKKIIKRKLQQFISNSWYIYLIGNFKDVDLNECIYYICILL